MKGDEEEKKPEITEVAQSQDKSGGGKPPEAAKPAKEKKDRRKAGGTVHVLRDGALHSVKIKTGLTDGRQTELIEGLTEGDAVIIDSSEPHKETTLMARLLTVIQKRY